MSDVQERIGEGFCVLREYLEVGGGELSCLILRLKMATTCTEDGHKQTTKTSTTI